MSTHEIAGGGVSVVRPDDELAGFLAVRHLASLGHRRICAVTGSRDRRVGHVRVQGYRRALAEAGVPFAPDLLEEGELDGRGGLPRRAPVAGP